MRGKISNRDIWSNSFSNAKHNDRTAKCRKCGNQIAFKQVYKGKLKWIPVELDGSTHTCYKK